MSDGSKSRTTTRKRRPYGSARGVILFLASQRGEVWTSLVVTYAAQIGIDLSSQMVGRTLRVLEAEGLLERPHGLLVHSFRLKERQLPESGLSRD